MPEYDGSRVYDPNGYAQLRAFGPFIDADTYEIQPTTYRTLIIASIVFGLAMCFALLATLLGIQQTKASRRPWKSVYIWMIWIELAACVVIAFECFLFLLYLIRPSLYFYMSILFLWSIQIQLLLQIIINRIRIILQDQSRGRLILISVATFIVLINISVFCIWIPARLQISERHIHINNVWDRVEKVLYLIVDGCLNWYFIRVVKANLVANGLQKYHRLVRFNQRIIVISLLMDVMIIGAMSIPNGFIYALFHPLAFLVKLNIEMMMANLIRKVALSNQATSNSFLVTFASVTADSSQSRSLPSQKRKSWLASLFTSDSSHSRWSQSLQQQEEGITKTEEFFVSSKRRSQVLWPLTRGLSQKNAKKEDGLRMEEVYSGSVEVLSHRSGSGAGSNRNSGESDIELVPPPPTMQR